MPVELPREEVGDLLRKAILRLEEDHPAIPELSPVEWLARVAEQLGNAELATWVQVEDPTEDRERRIAHFSAVSAEALRALGRFHPSPQRDAPPVKLVDEKLDIVLKGLDKLRTADEVIGHAVTMLGVAAAGAVDDATEARGERVERRLEDDWPPLRAFCHGLFDIARTYAEVIASELISTA